MFSSDTQRTFSGQVLKWKKKNRQKYSNEHSFGEERAYNAFLWKGHFKNRSQRGSNPALCTSLHFIIFIKVLWSFKVQIHFPRHTHKYIYKIYMKYTWNIYEKGKLKTVYLSINVVLIPRLSSSKKFQWTYKQPLVLDFCIMLDYWFHNVCVCVCDRYVQRCMGVLSMYILK